MAFDNVTFFELHLDGAQFGPESIGERTEHDEHHDDVHHVGYDQESSGAPTSGRMGRVLAMVGVGLGLSLAATYLARRFVGREATDIDVEMDAPEATIG